MIKMTTMTTVTAGAMLTTALAFTPQTLAAGGDWPAVLSQMPNDAQIVVCTRSLKELDGNFSQFIGGVELGQLGFMPGPLDALAMFGINTAAMNTNDAIGFAILKDRWDADLPPVLGFVPVNDYAGWTKALGATAVPDTNLSTFAMPDEPDPWYVRAIDGYAVLGLDQNLVLSYEKGAGNAGQWQDTVGNLGTGIVGGADISVMVNFDGLRPHLKEGLNQGMSEMRNNMAMMGGGMAPGMDGEDLAAMMEAYQGILNTAIDEMSAATLGLRFNGDGAALDTSMRWVEGGMFAKMMSGGNGESSNVLNNLPDNPYMFAMGMDAQNVNIADLLKMLLKDMPDAMKPGPTMAMLDMWKDIDGVAMAVYPSPGGMMMGGLLTNSAVIYTGNAAQLHTQMKDATIGLNGVETQGMTYHTEYTENAKEIAGISVDSFTMSFDAPPEMQAQLQQSMMMMYGPGGPGGYLAHVDDTLIMTMGRNSRLFESVVASVKGDGGGLGSNATHKELSGLLSPNPSGVVYVGFGPILKQVVPMAQMFMPGLDLNAEALGNMPPMAMSVTVADGEIQKTLALPAPLIKQSVDLAMKIQQAMSIGAGGGDGDEPDIF